MNPNSSDAAPLTRRDLLDALDAFAARLDTRFDAMGARIEAMDARIAAMDARIEAMDARIEAMDARIEGMGAKIGAMEVRIEAMDARIGAVDGKVEASEARLADRLERAVTTLLTGFHTHARLAHVRDTALETRVAQIENRLTDIELLLGKQPAA